MALMKLRREILAKVNRIVIKLGTGLLTDAQNHLSVRQIEGLVAQIATLHEQKKQIIIVSSGAIGAGMAELGLKQRPKHLDELQAAAAIGQSKLMAVYDELFGKFGITVAQILLTHDDLKDRTRHLNAHNTLATILAHGAVPIINENDTVAVEEIKFGDNDRLGALAATLIDADLLVILSHVEGLLEGEGRVIPAVPEITREIESLAGDTDRATSVGGMKSKIDSARIVTRAGIPLVIANGARANVLRDILAGDEVGTIFLPHADKLASRKRWIAFFQHPAGTVVVDDGAKEALCAKGKSLLAKGIVSSEGKFEEDDLVSIRDKNQVEFARGLTKVGSIQIKSATGVVIHRDDMVIL
ncbi:MAG: glutamate 5-kinase [Verrucomicrobiia bacterium]